MPRHAHLAENRPQPLTGTGSARTDLGMTDTSGIEPAGVPSGGSDLSGDDSPTGNAGTSGSDALAGDAGIAGNDPVTGDNDTADDDSLAELDDVSGDENERTSRSDALTDEDRASALEVDSEGINSATGIRSGTDIDSTNVAGNR